MFLACEKYCVINNGKTMLTRNLYDFYPFTIFYIVLLPPGIMSFENTNLYRITSPDNPCPIHRGFNCAYHVNIYNNLLKGNLLSRENFHSFQQLPDLLNIFGEENCLTFVRNYQYINLHPVEHPILLTRPDIAWFWPPRGKRNTDLYSFKIWVHASANTNGTILLISTGDKKADILLKLSHSKFWSTVAIKNRRIQYGRIIDAFVRLNMTVFSRVTKPWNCLVHLELYPAFKRFDDHALSYPAPFDYQHVFSNMYSIIPSETSHIVIYIVDREQHENVNYLLRHKQQHRDAIEKKTLLPMFSSYISHDLVFLVETVNWKSSGSIISQIDTVKILKACAFRSLSMTRTVVKDIKLENLGALRGWKRMSSVICNENLQNNVLLWTIASPEGNVGQQGESKDIDDLIFQFKMCKKFSLVDILGRSHGLPSPHPSLRMARVYVHLWTSILGNYSFFTDDMKECHCGTKVPVGHETVDNPFRNLITIRQFNHTFIRGKYLFPVIVLDKALQNLQFVSCGARGLKGLAFETLVIIFDHYIWALIVLSFCIFVLSIRLMVNKASYRNVLHGIFFATLVLEQGDQLPSSWYSVSRIRLILVGYFLAGIVISNAYKNTNVYQMIIPRKPILYEYFHQLIHDNFTVYTKAAVVIFTFSSLFSHKADPKRGKWEISTHDIFENDSNRMQIFYNFRLMSEVQALQKQIGQVNDDNIVIDLLKWVKFPPICVELVDRVINYGVDLLASKQPMHSKIRDLEAAMRKFYSGEERKGLLNLLGKCEKTALLLPEYEIIEYAKTLYDEGHSDISIGKESIGTKIAFSIKGFLPQYIFRRIESTNLAGLWLRWINLVKGIEILKFKDSKRMSLKKPDMSGNVLVIFMVLGLGLVCAAFLYFIELIENVFLKNDNQMKMIVAKNLY